MAKRNKHHQQFPPGRTRYDSVSQPRPEAQAKKEEPEPAVNPSVEAYIYYGGTDDIEKILESAEYSYRRKITAIRGMDPHEETYLSALSGLKTAFAHLCGVLSTYFTCTKIETKRDAVKKRLAEIRKEVRMICDALSKVEREKAEIENDVPAADRYASAREKIGWGVLRIDQTLYRIENLKSEIERRKAKNAEDSGYIASHSLQKQRKFIPQGYRPAAPYYPELPPEGERVPDPPEPYLTLINLDPSQMALNDQKFLIPVPGTRDEFGVDLTNLVTYDEEKMEMTFRYGNDPPETYPMAILNDPTRDYPPLLLELYTRLMEQDLNDKGS